MSITKRLFALALTAAILACSIPQISFAASLFEGTFASIQGGIVDRRDTATITPASTGTVIVPKPTGEHSSSAVKVDSYSWASKNIPLKSIRQIQIQYKFSGSTANLGHPKLTILPCGSSGLPESVTFYSFEDKIEKAASWKTLTFEIYTDETAKNNVSNDLRRKLVDQNEILRQIHFSFYGDTPASELTASQRLTIGNITISSTELVADKSYIKFDKGFPKARFSNGVRENQVIYATKGDTIVLPECPYEMDGFTFDGWVSWYAYKKYYPGDEMTVVGDTMLVADWKGEALPEKTYDYIAVDMQTYITGFIHPGTDRGTYTEGQTFDGVANLCKFVPNTELPDKDANGSALTSANLDSYSWRPAGVDITQYNYLSLVYYWKSEAPVSGAKMRWSVLANGLDISSSRNFDATMKANQWAVANFNISTVKNYLKSNAANILIHQCHIRPFLNNCMSQLHPNDELYLAKAIFYREKPMATPLFVSPAFKPIDESGNTAGITRAVTRGEALKAITRIINRENSATSTANTVFADITSDNPLNAYAVRAVYDGWLDGDPDGNFNPNAYLTSGEFLDWVTRIFRITVGARAGQDVGTPIAMPQSEFMFSAFNRNKPLTRGEFISIATALFAPLTGDKSGLVLPKLEDVSSSLPMHRMAASLTQEGVCADGQMVLALRNHLTEEEALDESIFIAGNKYIKELDTQSANRIAEIRATGNGYYDAYVAGEKNFGNVYFVSNKGKDSNDGKTPATAIATLDKLSTLGLKYGDAVFFERGSIFRQTKVLNAVGGVTYSSYGEGAKPEIWGSNIDLANEGSWTLFGQDNSGKKVWVYSKNICETGALFLVKDGEVVSIAAKEIPSYDSRYENPDEHWRVRGNTTEVFDTWSALDNDLEFVCFANKNPSTGELYLTASNNGLASTDPNYKAFSLPVVRSAVGELYFRCDAGNPATLYDSIEIAPPRNGIGISGEGVTIDNITIKFVGNHGIGSGTRKNLTVSNCEIGWIGGTIQHYNGGKTNIGHVTRFGNGVEIYGGCNNYVIDNCYIYEVYDAGITHQVGGQVNSMYMDDVRYLNNVIEYCTYNIEYFASPQDPDHLEDSYCFISDALIENNILRLAGYGWGQQRPDPAPSAIKGWPRDTNNARNYIIRGNIIDRSTHCLMEVGSATFGGAPYFQDNTYVQHSGNGYAYFHSDIANHGVRYYYGLDMDIISKRMNQDGGVFYYVEPIKWEHIYVYHRSNPPGTY